jgi:hypothetical protein
MTSRQAQHKATASFAAPHTEEDVKAARAFVVRAANVAIN